MMQNEIKQNFNNIVRTIAAGGLVVMKSDTIYGIFCSALDEKSVAKLHEIRNRAQKQGFIILCDSVKTVASLVGLRGEICNRLANIWSAPHATSVILAADNLREVWLADARETKPRICLRVPHDETLRKLLAETGPLCAPSANPPGQPPARNIAEARAYFGDKVSLYIDGGKCNENSPSRIIKFNSGGEVEIVRADGLAHPEDFVISRKRKLYKFAVFNDDPRCFDLAKWRERCGEIIAANREIILEVGAGSALFSVELARQNPDKIFIATDIKSDRMYRGARRASELKLKNIFFVRCDVARVNEILPADAASEIWITFPDPFARENYQVARANLAKFYHDFLRFPNDKDYTKNLAKYELLVAKLDKESRANYVEFLTTNQRKRLTSARFLGKYKKLLRNGGIINFKTDNAPLFEWSLENFAANGFRAEFLTRDLHNSDDSATVRIPQKVLSEAQIMTSYEERFASERLPISFARYLILLD